MAVNALVVISDSAGRDAGPVTAERRVVLGRREPVDVVVMVDRGDELDDRREIPVGIERPQLELAHRTGV